MARPLLVTCVGESLGYEITRRRAVVRWRYVPSKFATRNAIARSMMEGTTKSVKLSEAGLSMRTRSSRVFECWNVRCPYYAGYGVQLSSRDVLVNADELSCGVCHQGTVIPAPLRNSLHSTVTGGLFGGAVVGAVIAGLPGIVIASAIGFFLAVLSEPVWWRGIGSRK